MSWVEWWMDGCLSLLSYCKRIIPINWWYGDIKQCCHGFDDNQSQTNRKCCFFFNYEKENECMKILILFVWYFLSGIHSGFLIFFLKRIRKNWGNEGRNTMYRYLLKDHNELFLHKFLNRIDSYYCGCFFTLSQESLLLAKQEFFCFVFFLIINWV